MQRSIMIFLSLAVWGLSAYADEKAASRQNFTTAINQYLQANPACVEIRAGEQNKFPFTVVLTQHRPYQDEAIIFAFLAKLGWLTAQESVVNIQETSPFPDLSSAKSGQPKTVQARQIVYGLSETGKSAYKENVSD